MPLEIPNLKIDRNNLPTIGCLTILNSHNKMNCADVTIDGSITACGFKDGTITVWINDKDMIIDVNGKILNHFKIENTLKKLEEFKEQNYHKYSLRRSEVNPQADVIRDHRESFPEDGEEDVYDEIKKQRKFKLCGHSDAIFSISISPDKRYIVSGSYDQTVRLWSILTKTNFVVYKGHFSPVLSVKFSPYS